MKNSVFSLALAALVGCLLIPPCAQSGGDKDKPAKEPAKKPATHKVEAKPFRVVLNLKGTLEAAEVIQIAYRPEPFVNVSYSPGSQTIRTIVAHGATVAKGDTLVALDTRKLEQHISQLEADLKAMAASLELAEREQPLLEKSAPQELQTAERSKREADEDLEYFLKTDKAESIKTAEQYVRFASFNHDFAKEQLRQLEKMYKANDLTEETEQIILKRQRFYLEEALIDLKQAEVKRDYLLKTVLPRREKSLRDGVERQTLALERARETNALTLAQKRESLAKMRFDRDRTQHNLAMMQRERDHLTITAPAAGIVYHGKFANGQWESSPSLAARLVPGGSVSPDDVFMTLATPRPLVVRLAVDEKDASLIKGGLEGKIETTFDSEVRCPARVSKIAAAPATPGKYEALVNVEIGAKQESWMPGMACSVKFIPYAKKNALAVPSSAVFEEDDEHFVYVYAKGKETKREVRPGRTSGSRTEILSGLKAGEEILLERPAEKKDSAGGKS